MGCGVSSGRDGLKTSPAAVLEATTGAPEEKSRAVGSPAKVGAQQRASGSIAPPGSRYVRLIVCFPFKRNAAAEELLLRCCLPRVREHCRQHGWTLLALSISDEADPDLQNTRTDTMRLCRMELDKCQRLSAGPSMLVLLDRSTSLIGTLPPPSIPAPEFSKFLEYFHQEASAHAHNSSPAATSGQALATAATHPASHASQLLKRWYRQTKHTLSGTSDADYKLVTPPDLTDVQDSVFSPEAAGSRLSQREQMEHTARELKELGHCLSAAALPALFPEQEMPAESPGAGDAGEEHAQLGGRVYNSYPAAAAASHLEEQAASTTGAAQRQDGEGLVGGEGSPIAAAETHVEGSAVPRATTGAGTSLRDRRKARRSLGELPSVHGEADHEGGREGAGNVWQATIGTVAPAERTVGGDDGGDRQMSADLSYDVALSPLAAASGLKGVPGVTDGLDQGVDGVDESVGVEPSAPEGLIRASDDEATLPLAYDGHGVGAQATPQVKRVRGFAGKVLIETARPCPKGVLGRYEASCYETLIGLQQQRLGFGNGVCSLVPHGGLLSPPPPLEKLFVDPVAEEVVWEGSNVTDKVDFTKGVHVEWQTQKQFQDSGEALAAVSAFWGKGFLRRDEHQRLPRNTRRELHSLESHHEDGPETVNTQGQDTRRRRRGRKGEQNHPQSGDRSRDESLAEPGLPTAPIFAPKGESMTLHIDSLQVQGLRVKAGSSVRVEIFVGKNSGAEASRVLTSKKKLSASHAAEWGKMTSLPVQGDMLDEGVLHVRVVEPKLLGEPACLGTASMALCEAARHEDVEEDPMHHGKWVDLRGVGADFLVDEQAPEPTAAASLRVVLVVRAADSAHAQLDHAIYAVNCRQFGRGLREAEGAKDRFLELHNTRMAAKALEVIWEAKHRRSVVVPLVMRRLGLLAEHLALPDLDRLQASSASGCASGPPGDVSKGDAPSEGAARPQVPAHFCLVSLEDMEVGGAGRFGGIDAGDGEEVYRDEEGNLEKKLEEAADQIMDKTSYKRRMGGMAHRLALDDVGKARAILPPILGDGLEKITGHIIDTLDGNIRSSTASDHDDVLLYELKCHEQVQRAHVAGFTGYEKVVDDICHYVLDRPSHARPVFLVEGEAHGVGVSAVMSLVSERLGAMYDDRHIGARVITRFVGASDGSRYLETLLHGIILELQGLMMLADANDKKAQAAGRRQLMQQPSSWFAKLRAKSAIVGGLPELNQELRDLAQLASAKNPIVLVIDGIDCLLEAALGVHWDPTRSSSYTVAAAEVDAQDSEGAVLQHAFHRLFGWLPLSTLKGQDPLLLPQVRIVMSHNNSSERVAALFQKILSVRGTARLLKGVPTDEKQLIMSILQAMNARTGAHVPDSALSALIPPLVPPAARAPDAESASSSSAHKAGPVKSVVSFETLWLGLAMKRSQLKRAMAIAEHDPFEDSVSDGNLGTSPAVQPMLASTPPQHMPSSVQELISTCLQRLAVQVGKGLLQRLLGLLCACEGGGGGGMAEDELLDCLSFCTPRVLARQRATPSATAPSHQHLRRQHMRALGTDGLDAGEASQEVDGTYPPGAGASSTTKMEPAREDARSRRAAQSTLERTDSEESVWDAENWERGGEGVQPVSNVQVLRSLYALEEAGIVEGVTSRDGVRRLTLASRHIILEAARYAFAHGDAARAGAHAVLATYWMGREAPKGWTKLPKEHPTCRRCAAAHTMLMRNPMFPAQPWYWEGSAASSRGVDAHVHAQCHDVEGTAVQRPAAGPGRVYNVRKLQHLCRQMLCAGLIEAAQHLLTDLEYITIKFEAKRVYELVEEYEALRSTKRASGQGESGVLDDVGQFERFIMQSRVMFSCEPHLIFQAAANTQEDVPMSRAAVLALALQRNHPPWLHWLNAPRDNDITAQWTLQVHHDSIAALALSVDGAWIATAGSDRVCRIWEAASGVPKQALPRAPASVRAMAWSPDAHYLGVGDGDGGVKLWLRKRRETSADNVADFGVTAHSGPVHCMAFLSGADAVADTRQARSSSEHADNILLLVTAGADGTVKVWSTATQSVMRVFQDIQGCIHGLTVRAKPTPEAGSGLLARVISQRLTARRAEMSRRKSPHKARLPPVKQPNSFATQMEQHVGGGAQEAGARILCFGEDGCIRDLHVDSGECVRTYRGHGGAVHSADIVEDFDLMISSSEDRRCLLWRLSDASIVGVIRHDSPVSFVAIDLTSETIASVCSEGRLRLWDLHSMTRVGRTDAIGLQIRMPGTRYDGLHRVTALVKEQGLLVIGCPTGCIKAFSVRPFGFRAHAPSDPQTSFDASSLNSAANLKSELSALQAAGKTGRGDVPEASQGSSSGESQGSRAGTGVTAVSVVGTVMCTASSEGELAAWDLKTGHILWKLASGQRRITSLALEPGEARLLASASSHGEVLFWDIGQGRVKEPMAALAAHMHGISCIAFSSDGSLFLSASLDATLRVWNVFMGAKKADSQQHAASHTHAAGAVGVHANAKDPTGSSLGPLSPGAVEGDPREAPGTPRWHPPFLTLRLRPLHRLVGHIEAVTCAAFVAAQDHVTGDGTGGLTPDPSTRLIASSSLDGTLRLWNIATGEQLLPVLRPLGQACSIGCVAWAPGGRRLAAGCDDGAVRLWNLDAINPKERRHSKASKRSDISLHPDPATHEEATLRARSAFDVLADSLKVLGPDSLGHLKYLSLPATAGTRADVFSGRAGSWMVAEGLRARVVDGHRLPVSCVAYTRSGALIVSACVGGTAKVWSAQHGTLLRTLLRSPRGVRVRCLALAVEPSDRVWVGCADGMMRGARIPEQEAEELAAQAKLAAAQALRLKAEVVADAGAKKTRKAKKSAARVEEEEALHEQERVLATAGAVLAAGRRGAADGQGLDEEALAYVRSASVVSEKVFGSGVPVVAVAHSERVAASVMHGCSTIELRDPRTLAIKTHLEGHLEPVSCLCMDPAGGWLVSGSSDGAVKVWETDVAHCRLSQPCFRQGVAAVTIQRSVELAAAGSSLGDVEVIDFRASTIVSQFSVSEARVAALHFANDARLVAFAHDDGVFGLRDLRQNKTTTLGRGSAMSKKEAMAAAAAAAALVADHSGLVPAAIAGAADDEVNLAVSGTPQGDGGAVAGRTGAKSKGAGGKTGIGGMFGKLASAFAGADKGVKVPVTRTMCCSPDGFTLVRSLGSSVEVWDIRRPSARLFCDTSHSAAVTGLVALDDGGTVASAGEDCLVRLWCVPGRGPSRWSTGLGSWADLKAGSSRAPGVFDYATRGVSQGSASVSFYCRQGVTALGGFQSALFAAGDAAGRLYALSLLPGKLGA